MSGTHWKLNSSSWQRYKNLILIEQEALTDLVRQYNLLYRSFLPLKDFNSFGINVLEPGWPFTKQRIRVKKGFSSTGCVLIRFNWLQVIVALDDLAHSSKTEFEKIQDIYRTSTRTPKQTCKQWNDFWARFKRSKRLLCQPVWTTWTVWRRDWDRTDSPVANNNDDDHGDKEDQASCCRADDERKLLLNTGVVFLCKRRRGETYIVTYTQSHRLKHMDEHLSHCIWRERWVTDRHTAGWANEHLGILTGCMNHFFLEAHWLCSDATGTNKSSGRKRVKWAERACLGETQGWSGSQEAESGHWLGTRRQHWHATFQFQSVSCHLPCSAVRVVRILFSSGIFLITKKPPIL